jgi:hypothetical protein
MLTPKIQQLSTLPTAHGEWLPGAHCGHRTPVGTCAACQRRHMAEVTQLPHDSAQTPGRT